MDIGSVRKQGSAVASGIHVVCGRAIAALSSPDPDEADLQWSRTPCLSAHLAQEAMHKTRSDDSHVSS